MVFVECFGIVDASVQAWGVVLGDSDDGLNKEERIGDEPENGMRTPEVFSFMGDLRVLDDDETGDKSIYANGIEDGMDVRSLPFLGLRMGRLKDQDGLRDEEEASLGIVRI